MKTTAKALRFHVKELLASVSRGEEVIITYRGKPKAKLVPIDNNYQEEKKSDDELFGIWKDNPAVKNVEAYVRNKRKGRFK